MVCVGVVFMENIHIKRMDSQRVLTGIEAFFIINISFHIKEGQVLIRRDQSGS